MSEENKEESKLEQVTDKVVHNVEDAAVEVKETAKEVFDAAKDVMSGGEIPEAKKSLVMGIVGLVCAVIYIGAPLAVVFGIIAMKKSKIAFAKVDQDPQKYKKEKVKSMIGKFTGLGAVILGAIITVALIMAIVAALSNG
jgi:hypothetical protein